MLLSYFYLWYVSFPHIHVSQRSSVKEKSTLDKIQMLAKQGLDRQDDFLSFFSCRAEILRSQLQASASVASGSSRLRVPEPRLHNSERESPAASSTSKLYHLQFTSSFNAHFDLFVHPQMSCNIVHFAVLPASYFAENLFCSEVTLGDFGNSTEIPL